MEPGSDYIAATGKRGADRDEFADAVDFIGWYVNETAQTQPRRQTAMPTISIWLITKVRAGFAKGSYRKNRG